jgi:hypothetical protein
MSGGSNGGGTGTRQPRRPARSGQSICDRVMVIVDGRLQAIDEPVALLERNDFFHEVTDITLRQAAS